MVDTQAKIETVTVEEGERFVLSFQDEVLEIKALQGAKRTLRVTILRRGV